MVTHTYNIDSDVADGLDWDGRLQREVSVALGAIEAVGFHPVQAPTYTIFKQGSTFYRRNGSTGEVDDSEANPLTLTQRAATAMTDGGLLLLKRAVHDWGTGQLLITQDWKGFELATELGTEIRYSGADYAIKVTGARNALNLFWLHLENASAKGVWINDQCNVAFIRRLEGHTGAAGN